MIFESESGGGGAAVILPSGGSLQCRVYSRDLQDKMSQSRLFPRGKVTGVIILYFSVMLGWSHRFLGITSTFG